jgi:N-acyl-D-amino-acid deacylase
MRDEESRLMESVEETIRVGEVNNIPVEISHHKVKGKSNWGKINATLREMERLKLTAMSIPILPQAQALLPSCRPGFLKAVSRRWWQD